MRAVVVLASCASAQDLFLARLDQRGTGFTDGGNCTSDVDCNMAGECQQGLCSCEAAWTGDHCELLHFGKAYKCEEGGLCMDGSNDFVASWGGNVVRDSTDSSYHMYAASFAKNGTLDVWLTKSRVVHASSSSPEGPYTFHDVALGDLDNASAWDGLTQHNPEAVRAPDGTYVLFYMGAQRQATTDLPGVDSNYSCPLKPGDTSETVCMQRVGIATANYPAGPWTRRAAPILDAGPAGDWDDLFTTNPTPWMFANGSVLLIYKARSRSNPNVMSTGVAFAEHWSGPYERRSGKPVKLPGNCEDAGIYRSAKTGVYRMVLHCGCNYQAVWSMDGLSWQATAGPQPWCEVSYGDGTTGKMSRRERPKWLLNDEGLPTHLITGVQSPEAHNGQTFTLVQQLL